MKRGSVVRRTWQVLHGHTHLCFFKETCWNLAVIEHHGWHLPKCMGLYRGKNQSSSLWRWVIIRKHFPTHWVNNFYLFLSWYQHKESIRKVQMSYAIPYHHHLVLASKRLPDIQPARSLSPRDYPAVKRLLRSSVIQEERQLAGQRLQKLKSSVCFSLICPLLSTIRSWKMWCSQANHTHSFWPAVTFPGRGGAHQTMLWAWHRFNN